MLADPQTKTMQPTRLLEALANNDLDFEGTAEVQVTKMMKQKQRAAAKKKGENETPSYSELDAGAQVDIRILSLMLVHKPSI